MPSSLLVLIAATKPGAEKQEFKERYLFALTALVPIAYGFYVRHAKPLRSVVIGVAVCVAVAAARLPLTQYATSTFKTDSQFLFAISESQSWLGSANSSLIVALLATVAAIVAVVVAFRGERSDPVRRDHRRRPRRRGGRRPTSTSGAAARCAASYQPTSAGSITPTTAQ